MFHQRWPWCVKVSPFYVFFKFIIEILIKVATFLWNVYFGNTMRTMMCAPVKIDRIIDSVGTFRIRFASSESKTRCKTELAPSHLAFEGRGLSKVGKWLELFVSQVTAIYAYIHNIYNMYIYISDSHIERPTACQICGVTMKLYQCAVLWLTCFLDPAS